MPGGGVQTRPAILSCYGWCFMHARPVVPGLPALVLAALIGTMAMMSFVAVIGPVVRMLGLSEWHAGLSVTAAGVLWMLAARPWGQLSDRIGRKRVLMLAMSAYTVVYIALAVFIDVALQAVPPVLVSVLVLVGARGLIGLFYAAVPPTAAALIADKAPTGQRAKFLARLGSANALGMVLGPAAAGWPIRICRWRCMWPHCCRCLRWHCWPGGCRPRRRWRALLRNAASR